MLQKGLWHGGFNAEATLYSRKSLSVKAGVGTWAERQELLDAYMETATRREWRGFWTAWACLNTTQKHNPIYQRYSLIIKASIK